MEETKERVNNIIDLTSQDFTINEMLEEFIEEEIVIEDETIYYKDIEEELKDSMLNSMIMVEIEKEFDIGNYDIILDKDKNNLKWYHFNKEYFLLNSLIRDCDYLRNSFIVNSNNKTNDELIQLNKTLQELLLKSIEGYVTVINSNFDLELLEMFEFPIEKNSEVYDYFIFENKLTLFKINGDFCNKNNLTTENVNEILNKWKENLDFKFDIKIWYFDEEWLNKPRDMFISLSIPTTI